MAVDTSLLTDYSWSDIQKAAKAAMMNAAVGGAELSMPDGRKIKRMTMDEAKQLYDFATQMVNSESDDSSGIALIEFGDAQ